MNLTRICTLLPFVCVSLAGLTRPALLPARTIVEAGSATVWKYLDDGAPPDAAWRQVGYEESKWKAGQAPLGFGEARLATQLNPGVDAKHRTTTFWFRREFDAPRLQSGASRAALPLRLSNSGRAPFPEIATQ
jgi:hypothetical protein